MIPINVKITGISSASRKINIIENLLHPALKAMESKEETISKRKANPQEALRML